MSGTEKITVLNTKVERKIIIRMPDGELREKDLPPVKSRKNSPLSPARDRSPKSPLRTRSLQSRKNHE